MRSIYRFSLIALAVGVLALCAAGSASAASHEGMKGVSIGGSMNAGIEMVDNGTISEFGIQSEAVLDFKASDGPVSFKVRLEVNDNKTTLDNVRNEIAWKIGDLTLTFSGMSFGEPAGSIPFGATTVGQFTPFGSSAGHQAGATQWVFGVNDPSMDINFKSGSMDFGLVLNPNFALDQAASGTTSATAAAAADEAMTLTPYFNGKFGNLGVHFYYAVASGTADGTTLTVDPEATEMSIAVIFAGDGFKIGAQFVTGTYTDGQSATAGEEHTTGALNVGGSFGPVTFHFVTETDDNDTTSTEAENITDIAVAYSGKISDKASWTVGYASNNNDTSGAETTVLAFGLGLKY